MSDRIDIGAVRDLKIDVLTETGWFDDARFKEDMAAGGGSEQTQYRIAWDAENAGGYAALLTLTLLVEQQKMLSALMSKGATVIACPMCMKHYGVKDADLIEGVKVGNPDLTGNLLFKEDTKILTW